MKRTLLLMMVVSGVAAAQSPPIEIKGVHLGDPAEAFAAHIPSGSCGDHDCSAIGMNVSRMSDEWKFGPASPSRYTADLCDRTICKMQVAFYEASFDAVVAALTVKYGTPTSDATHELRNGFGAVFPDRIVSWLRPEGSINAEQRISKDYSAVWMLSQAWTDKVAADRKKRANTDAGKL